MRTSEKLQWLSGVTLLLILLMTSCATNKIDWASRVGAYTYDQAVLEMGPPERFAKLEDNTRVADWLTTRGHYEVYPNQSAYPYGTGPVVQSYHGYQTADYYIRLTFGPDGKLRSWKKIVE